MANTKKGKKVHRRTNAEIRRVEARQRVEDAQQRSLMNSFLRRTIVDPISELWERIKSRDKSYEPRTIVECDDFFNGSQPDSEDEDSDEDEDSSDDGSSGGDETDSDDEDTAPIDPDIKKTVMFKFMKAIRNQLQSEANTKDKEKMKEMKEERWLMEYLGENGFWIRKECVHSITKKLNAAKDKRSHHNMELNNYYRDIRVWFPDIQYGVKPVCPYCLKNSNVGVQGYCSKTYGRRVISIDSTYFIMTRKYQCHSCKKKRAEEIKHSINGKSDQGFIFRGYNETSLSHMPKQLGLVFPAVHSKTYSIDKTLLNLMRPLFDASIRPSRLRKIVAELHETKFMIDAIVHEYSNECELVPTEHQMRRFSAFHEREGYDGFIPETRWFRYHYFKFMTSIRPYQDETHKVREMDICKIDGTHQAIKKFRNVNGTKVVETALTLVNEHDEERVQIFTPTESSDVLKEPIKNMLDTMKELGHPGPRICYVDNPSQSQWLLDEIPSLRKYQDYLDSLTEQHNDSNSSSESDTNEEQANESNEYDSASSVGKNATMIENIEKGVAPLFDDNWFDKNVLYLTKVQEINNNAMALLSQLELDDNDSLLIVELGLDMEWYVPTIDGVPIAPGEETDTIQVSYIDNDLIRVSIYHITEHRTIPFHLQALLQHPRTRFAGSLVSGDLHRLNRENNDLQLDVDLKALNLEAIAKSRGVILPSKGLDGIIFALFGVRVSKSLRLEKWNVKKLPIRLQKYAAYDAAWSLAAKMRLNSMPDFTKPLLPSDIVGGMDVDIAPYVAVTKNLFLRGSRIAEGQIVRETQRWTDIPANLNPNPLMISGDKPGWYLVEVTEVMAPAMKIKDLKVKGSNRFATFVDFGEVPFRVCLPLEMLRIHYNERPNMLTAPRSRIPSVHEEHSLIDEGRQDERQSFIDLLEDVPIEQEIDTETRGNGEWNLDMVNLDDGDKIALVEDCLRRGVQAGISLPGNAATSKDIHLDPPPESISDKYAAVNGSCFHGGHRFEPIIPSDHCDVKGFHVSFSEALFAWDSIDLKKLYDAMKGVGMVKDWHDFLLLRYFRRVYFCERVQRHCLPPSKLYWRVRAVFEVFGNRIDPKSKKRLFNKTCWTKANNLLKEILQGYYSDPPGIELYSLKKKPGTRIVIYDRKLNLPLLDCKRDTNGLESKHGRMNYTAGKRSMGLEYGDHVLAERRFRATIDASKKNRLDFPHIHHYSPWLMDILQMRVESKHDVLLYPSWVNISVLSLQTKEKFGFVSLASTELRDAINESVTLPDSYKMPPSLKFLSERTGFKIAPQPWGRSKEERKLYPELLLHEQQMGGSLEQQCIRMCLSILPKVNGIITPKLPVYNRLQAKKFSRNTRIQASANQMKRKVAALSAVNALTEMQLDDIEIDDASHETRAVARKKQALEYMKKSFPTNVNIPILPRASLPKPIALPDPRAFQPIFGSVPFVQNIPIIPFVHYPSFENQMSGPRSSIRTCRLFCQGTNCIGSKRRWPNGMCKYCPVYSAWLNESWDLMLSDVVPYNNHVENESRTLTYEGRKRIIAAALFFRDEDCFIEDDEEEDEE